MAKNLRHYLANDVDINAVLDFGMAQNFGAATVCTCILSFTKVPSRDNTQSCYATNDRAGNWDDPRRLLQG